MAEGDDLPPGIVRLRDEDSSLTLEYAFDAFKYPKMRELAARLKFRARAPLSKESDEAGLLLDELKHLAVKAFKLKHLPR